MEIIQSDLIELIVSPICLIFGKAPGELLLRCTHNKIYPARSNLREYNNAIFDDVRNSVNPRFMKYYAVKYGRQIDKVGIAGDFPCLDFVKYFTGAYMC